MPTTCTPVSGSSMSSAAAAAENTGIASVSSEMVSSVTWPCAYAMRK